MNYPEQQQQSQSGNSQWQKPVMRDSTNRDSADAKKPGKTGGVDPKLQDKIKSGARWLYWIAALSIINTILWHTGMEATFVVGLGMTQIADGVVYGVFGGNAPVFVTILSIIVSAAISGGFALFGYLASRHSKAAFIAGLVFYSLDTLLFLLIGEWFGLAFHVVAFLGILGGLTALGKYNKNKAARKAAYATPVVSSQESVPA